MEKVRGFGIIPLHCLNGVWEAFLIQRLEGFWEFPKGHAELGEEPLATAKRELLEETGLTVDKLYSDEPLIIHYEFHKNKKLISKEVIYYLAEVSGEVFLQESEVKKGAWLSLEEADKQLTYENSRALVPKIKTKLNL